MNGQGNALEQLLRVKFGYKEFRGQQRAIIERTLEGESSLVIMPTGMGKSLCYQLPAFAGDGMTVVLSPLIALMDDQARQAQGWGLKVGVIHSGRSREQREGTLNDLRNGHIQLLYVTPERFRKPEFLEVVAKVKVSLLAVDEAHCISQWGHDFRPDYSRLGQIRRELGGPPCLALTATATPQVQRDILESLNIPDAKIFVDGVERRNLFLGVHPVLGSDEKIRFLASLRHQYKGPALFYFSLVATLENFSRELRRIGLSHVKYHGQLDDRTRRESQKLFMDSHADLILATPAFGLGVNKPDVRLLVHAELPGSIEAYYQEVGRAGRDGEEAQCQLLYDSDDVSIQMDFIKWGNPDPEFIKTVHRLIKGNLARVQMEGAEYLRGQMNFHNRRDFRIETSLNLLERWGCLDFPNRNFKRLQVLEDPPDDFLNSDHYQRRLTMQNQKLLDLVQWTGLKTCRRQPIHEYFGVLDPNPCGFCDNCMRGKT